MFFKKRVKEEEKKVTVKIDDNVRLYLPDVHGVEPIEYLIYFIERAGGQYEYVGSNIVVTIEYSKSNELYKNIAWALKK